MSGPAAHQARRHEPGTHHRAVRLLQRPIRHADLFFVFFVFFELLPGIRLLRRLDERSGPIGPSVPVRATGAPPQA